MILSYEALHFRVKKFPLLLFFITKQCEAINILKHFRKMA